MTAITKPTAAGQKITQNNVNYISASDGGSGFVWLLDLSAPTAVSSALNFNQDVSLYCQNSWIARSIGAIGTSSDFAAPDASNHYKALRDMVIDVAVTALTSEGSGLTIGFTVQLYRVGAWVDTYTPTSISNPSAGVVPFHGSAQIALKAGDYIRFLTNANNAGGNSYPGNRVFRVSIVETPTLTLMPANTTVLTPRNITGSVTSVGYDNVELPYQIPLAADKVLDTVTLNGTATTNFDANTGIVRIKPNGGDVAVAHTIKIGATFTSLQRAEFSTTTLAITSTDQDYTGLTQTLQEGDLLEIQHMFNGNIGERELVWVRVQAGSTQRQFPWADTTNNTHYFTFPNPLTNKFKVRQVANGSSPSIVSVKVWRDAANKTVVPTGTTVATAYPITVNGGTNGSFTGHEGIGPETFYLTMPVDQEIDAFPTVAGVNLRNRQAGMISVDRAVGAGALALTGITFRAMAPNSVYFGTWENQAGDSGATNGGHTCTRRLLRGTGITTANDSLLTLSGGIYKVRVGVVRHFAVNTWRATTLLVDGVSAETFYSGSDGSNWESGGGPLEWIVDATSANKTVQARRISSTNNGNCSGYLSVERISPSVVPEGTVLFAPRSITGTGITATIGRDNTTLTVPITGIAAGSEVTSVSATGGATVLIRDSGRGGTAYVDVVPNSADTVITSTQTVWRRTLTATVNGAAGTVNGVASANVSATAAVDFWLTLPANHLLTGAPTVTGGTLASWSADGSGVITPNNTGNITVTANSAQPGARSVYSLANSGTWVDFGSIGIRIPASGNRSIQLRSNTGANIVCNYITWLGWDSTRAPSAGVTFTTAGAYLESGWNFGNTGNSQQAIIHDTTSGRQYRVTAMINTGYNNIHYSISEIT